MLLPDNLLVQIHLTHCHLTDERTQRIQSLMLVLEDISSHRFEDLTHRRQMLVYQLAIMYEFVNHYRKEQDRLLKTSRHKTQYTQFCKLVVAHYREEKELLFYAKEMGVSLKHLNKIVHEVTHDMTPREWIEHYVVTQAKRLIEAISNGLPVSPRSNTKTKVLVT